MYQSLEELLRKYEEMVGQERSVYFDADQIESIAFSFESKEDFSEALRVVDYGLSLHPGNPNLLLCKAKYLLFLDYIEEAGALLPLLPTDGEESALIRIEYAFACGRPEEGMALIDAWMADLTWEFALDVVSILWGYVSYQEIVAYLKRALDRLPDEPHLLQELANIYQDNANPEGAIELYNRLLDIDPYQSEIWYELARSHVALKAFEQAIEATDFGLAIDSQNGDMLCLKGFCLYDLGRIEEALTTFLEYAELGINPEHAYEYVSDCYVKLEQMPQALEYLRQDLELNPDNEYMLYQAAYCLQDIGNTPEARKHLYHTLKLNPNQLDCWLLLGECLMQEDNFREAYDAYKHALEMDTENVDLLATLGDICEKLDRMPDAADYYARAHELRKFDIKLIFRLLLAYYATGQTDKAEQLSAEINRLTAMIEGDVPGMTEQEKEEIRGASTMVESLKRMLHEILHQNRN